MTEKPWRKSIAMIVLEVVLISGGVFLGMLAEQWRDNASEREMAETVLRRLRTEIATNRGAVAERQPYHQKVLESLRAYLKAPDGGKSFTVDMPAGLGPVFFQRTAWDLAVATGSLANIDPDLAFSLSAAYTTQQDYADLQRAIVEGAVYGRSWNQDFDGYWQSVSNFLGDMTYFDPTLLKAYDEVLPLIQHELNE